MSILPYLNSRLRRHKRQRRSPSLPYAVSLLLRYLTVSSHIYCQTYHFLHDGVLSGHPGSSGPSHFTTKSSLFSSGSPFSGRKSIFLFLSFSLAVPVLRSSSGSLLASPEWTFVVEELSRSAPGWKTVEVGDGCVVDGPDLTLWSVPCEMVDIFR